MDKILEIAGYAYDPEQDLYYSTMYAWQRNFGYCRLYDEAAAPLHMIIDCEPIYFEYAGKRWLIEFWKGQYAMAMGCEVGIYNTEGPDLNIPGVFNGTFYHTASDQELLKIDCTLYKNGQPVFQRKERHWWLTGFKLGSFAEPSELTMTITINFRNRTMRKAFTKGLLNAGYSPDDFTHSNHKLTLCFDQPRTPQPYTRTPLTDSIIQIKNKLLCDIYQEITGGAPITHQTLHLLKKHAPELYSAVLLLGKNKHLYEKYEAIASHLKQQSE